MKKLFILTLICASIADISSLYSMRRKREEPQYSAIMDTLEEVIFVPEAITENPDNQQSASQEHITTESASTGSVIESVPDNTLLLFQDDNDDSYEIFEQRFPKKRKTQPSQSPSENAKTTTLTEKNDAFDQEPYLFDFDETFNPELFMEDLFPSDLLEDEIIVPSSNESTENTLNNRDYTPENSQSIHQTPEQGPIIIESNLQPPDTQPLSVTILGTHKAKQQTPANNVTSVTMNNLYPNQADDSVYVCNIKDCRALYYDKKLFELHIQKHKPKYEFSCHKPGCFESFEHNKDLRRHIRSDHKKPNNSNIQ